MFHYGKLGFSKRNMIILAPDIDLVNALADESNVNYLVIRRLFLPLKSNQR